MKKNNQIDDDQLDAWIAEEFPLLDVRNVPEKFRHLIPLASKWGITDDLLRDRLLQRSSDETLEMLEKAVRPYHAELDEWLAGPESHSPEISDEYLAFSYLRLATDGAKIVLSRRHNSSNQE